MDWERVKSFTHDQLQYLVSMYLQNFLARIEQGTGRTFELDFTANQYEDKKLKAVLTVTYRRENYGEDDKCNEETNERNSEVSKSDKPSRGNTKNRLADTISSAARSTLAKKERYRQSPKGKDYKGLKIVESEKMEHDS